MPPKSRLILRKTLKTKKKENEIDLGLIFELTEEDKFICNQVPLNILMYDMEKIEVGSLKMVSLL